MAELTPLYMDISNVYSGDELGLPYRDIMGEGVVGSGDLAVTQHAAGADLSVDVAAGAAWVRGDTNPDAQPTYRVRNDAVVNLGITPDPSNPRKAIIVAQITDETFAGTGRTWALEAIHGTPAASPVEPALPDSALKLAVITVPAAAASIVTANIADARVYAKAGGSASPISVGPPANPRHNMEWLATDVDSAGTCWRFRYNALSASPYKWEFVGGSAFENQVPTTETTSTQWGSTADLATVGPKYTTVREGDYRYEFTAYGNNSVAGDGMIIRALADTTYDSNGLSFGSSSGAGQNEALAGKGTFLGVLAGKVIKLTYAAISGGTATFTNRNLRVVPVRVK